jgi:hypothetical protein
MRGRIAQEVVNTLEAVDERTETTRKIGCEFCVTFSQGLPEGHPLRFDTPESVPPELAHTAVLYLDADLQEAKLLQFALHALPIAARAAAEDFYFPREVLRGWFGEWTPEETLARIKRMAEFNPKREPVRVEKTPGRNDPCPCGSGKKWKKCHGAGAAPGA